MFFVLLLPHSLYINIFKSGLIDCSSDRFKKKMLEGTGRQTCLLCSLVCVFGSGGFWSGKYVVHEVNLEQ